MKLWLDDIRTPPEGWHWVKTSQTAIQCILGGTVEEISLDHDLGDDIKAGTGYDVATAIEHGAFVGTIKRLQWHIHSANPVGVSKMKHALQNADRFWNEHA